MVLCIVVTAIASPFSPCHLSTTLSRIFNELYLRSQQLVLSDPLQPFRLSSNSFFLLRAIMARKGGVKHRLAAVDSDDDILPIPGASSSSAMPSSANHGGLRQRMKRARVDDIETQHEDLNVDAELPLTASLRKMWASGQIQSPAVQEFANSAMRQGAVGLERLSKIGASGARPKNMFRDLCQAFGVPDGAPCIQYVRLPLAEGSSLVPVIMPHLFFQHLYKERQEDFKQYVLGGLDDLSSFWSSKPGKRMVAKKHPELSRRRKRLLNKTVPLGLHGDGGEFSHQDSVNVISWNSLVGVGETKHKRFVFTLLKQSQMKENCETWDALWKVFAWSINVLLSGKSPTTDWLDRDIEGGMPLADDFSGCMVQMRGDWAFYCETLGFPRHNEVANMCWICNASVNHDRLWTDAKDTAGWRPTIRSHESYTAQLASLGKQLPALFRYVTGFRLEYIMIDVLHCVDLGVASHVAGSIMEECSASMGPNKAERCKALHADLKAWYAHQAKDVHVYKIKGKITPERLKNAAGFPKFKGKAAETRHLSGYLVDLASRHLDGSDHAATRLAIAQLLDRFYVVLKNNGMFLTPESESEIATIGKQLVILYNALSTAAAATQTKTWKFSPKFHMWLHLCEIQAGMYNPRFFWTYADEDLVGQMLEVAQTCHASTLADTALYKYLLLHFP